MTSADTLEGLGVDGVDRAVRAAGAVLAYCERARLTLTPGFVHVRRRSDSASMRLDTQTRRNLELVAPLGGGVSLAALLDRTRTPMGGRLLRARLLEPLTEPLLILARHDAVAELADAPRLRDTLGEALAAVRDLERLVARCVQRSAGPRDLGAVRQACAALPAIQDILSGVRSGELTAAAARCVAPGRAGGAAARAARRRAARPPPATAAASGPAPTASSTSSSPPAPTRAPGSPAWRRAERARTGIGSLKVGYNRVFGYYIEVPNAHRDAVPGDYVRKQTLVGAERYITADLKERETVVLGARERALAREQQLLEELAAAVAAHAAVLLDAAAAVAIIDVHRSLACVAVEECWVRPLVDSSGVIDIDQGRHPLVERALGAGRFVPNDCRLDAVERIVVLTGPNMAGKSTFLRQVALLTLLAQVGSFVPAATGAHRRVRPHLHAHRRAGRPQRRALDVHGGDGRNRGDPAPGHRRAAWSSSTRSAGARRRTTACRSRRRWSSTSTRRRTSTAARCSPPTTTSSPCSPTTCPGSPTPASTSSRRATASPSCTASSPAAPTAPTGSTWPGSPASRPGCWCARASSSPTSSASARWRARAATSPTSSASASPLPEHPVIAELAQLDIEGLTPIAALNKLAELRERAAP